jgi:hypothetical protein
MVQREESRRSVMNTQPHEPEETKAFAIRHPKPNPNLSTANRGDLTVLLKCEHYKREGHKEEDCWFLHPELRPRGRGRGGGVNFKNFRRQGELREERKEKRVLGAKYEKTEASRVHSNPAPSQSQIGQPSHLSQDQMWQMMQQLTMLLNQNSSKNFGIAANFTSNFSQKKLDF